MVMTARGSYVDNAIASRTTSLIFWTLQGSVYVNSAKKKC